MRDTRRSYNRDSVNISEGIATTEDVREAMVRATRSAARENGYTGESCPECANFTLKRHASQLFCDTCQPDVGASTYEEPDLPDDGS